MPGIKVNAPCIVSILDKDGEKTVSVADPTHKIAQIKLALDENIVRSKCRLRLLLAKDAVKPLLRLKPRA
jgi:hypothetical protein